MSRRGDQRDGLPGAVSMRRRITATSAIASGVIGSILATTLFHHAAFSWGPGDTQEWLSYFDDAYLAAKFAHTFRGLGMPHEGAAWLPRPQSRRLEMGSCDVSVGLGES